MYRSKKFNLRNQPSERGAALIVSLVFLTVLTLTGVAGTQVNMLEERMAGNMRDRSLAFQAAETALKAAEAQLVPGSLPSFTDAGTGGFFKRTTTAPPDVLHETFWTDNLAATSNAKVARYSHTLAGLKTQPAYVIEELPYSDNASVTGSSLETGTAGGSTTARWYRITGRGTGGTDTAVVTLQSVFRCPGCP